jgi:hypothetical protein
MGLISGSQPCWWQEQGESDVSRVLGDSDIADATPTTLNLKQRKPIRPLFWTAGPDLERHPRRQQQVAQDSSLKS